MVTEPGRGPAVAGLATHTAAAEGEQKQLFSEGTSIGESSANCAVVKEPGRTGQDRSPAAG
jgi:hypothetical protein